MGNDDDARHVRARSPTGLPPKSTQAGQCSAIAVEVDSYSLGHPLSCKSVDRRGYAVHTRAVTEALGASRGLEVFARAGFESLVVWVGEDGEHIDSISQALTMNLAISAIALPKACGVKEDARGRLKVLIDRVREETPAPISIIFGDDAAAPQREDDLQAIAEWIDSLGPGILVENNGRASERFASLAELRCLLDLVVDLAIALDIGHIAAAGIDDDVTPVANRIAHVELHDNDGVSDRHLPLGRGTGRGAFEQWLKHLRWLPTTYVIETDARMGTDVEGWVHSLAADRARLREALANRTVAAQ